MAADSTERRDAATDDLCAHGCEREGTVQHADGRLLCQPCYMVETAIDEALARMMGEQDPFCPTFARMMGEQDPFCPTCSPAPRYIDPHGGLLRGE